MLISHKGRRKFLAVCLVMGTAFLFLGKVLATEVGYDLFYQLEEGQTADTSSVDSILSTEEALDSFGSTSTSLNLSETQEQLLTDTENKPGLNFKLRITSPVNGSALALSSVIIKGFWEGDSPAHIKCRRESIETEADLVLEHKKWECAVSLKEGENQIVVSAYLNQELVAEEILNLVYIPSSPEQTQQEDLNSEEQVDNQIILPEPVAQKPVIQIMGLEDGQIITAGTQHIITVKLDPVPDPWSGAIFIGPEGGAKTKNNLRFQEDGQFVYRWRVAEDISGVFIIKVQASWGGKVFEKLIKVHIITKPASQVPSRPSNQDIQNTDQDEQNTEDKAFSSPSPSQIIAAPYRHYFWAEAGLPKSLKQDRPYEVKIRTNYPAKRVEIVIDGNSYLMRPAEEFKVFSFKVKPHLLGIGEHKYQIIVYFDEDKQESQTKIFEIRAQDFEKKPIKLPPPEKTTVESSPQQPSKERETFEENKEEKKEIIPFNKETEPVKSQPSLDKQEGGDTKKEERIEERKPEEIVPPVEQQPQKSEPKKEVKEEAAKEGELPPAVEPEPKSIPLLCWQAGLDNWQECKRFLALPASCQQAGIIDFDECVQFLSLPSECQEKGLSAKQCFSVSAECRQKGIFDPKKCATKKVILPELCLKYQHLSISECEQFLLQYKRLDPWCQKNGIVELEKCQKALPSATLLSEECLRAEIKNPEKCGVFMRLKYSVTAQATSSLPLECKVKGRLETKDCQNYLLSKYLPLPCWQQGKSEPEECRQFLFGLTFNPTQLTQAWGEGLPEECRQAGKNLKQKCYHFLQEVYFPLKCQEANIQNPKACKQFLAESIECKDESPEECKKRIWQEKIGPKCQKQGIKDPQECRTFLVSQLEEKIKCEGQGKDECRFKLAQKHLEQIVVQQDKLQNFEAGLLKLAAKKISTEQILSNKKEELPAFRIEEISSVSPQAQDVLPLKKAKTKLRVFKAQEKVMLTGAGEVVQAPPLVLALDSDEDGLSDDLEKRLQTDPNSPDSDGDGYDDYVEVKNGYNPLGEGRWTSQHLAPIEKALLDGVPLEHPKIEGELDDSLQVQKIKNQKDGYALEGKAQPDEIITLYFYSELPLVVTVKADAEGRWYYELEGELKEGEHKVYVAMNNEEGRIIKKSQPLTFFIKGAKAVSAEEYFTTQTVAVMDTEQKAMFLYMVLAALLVGLAIGLYVFILMRRRY